MYAKRPPPTKVVWTKIKRGKIMNAQSANGQPVDPDEEKKLHDQHDEELVEEWEDESFPASDPPSNY